MVEAPYIPLRKCIVLWKQRYEVVESNPHRHDLNSSQTRRCSKINSILSHRGPYPQGPHNASYALGPAQYGCDTRLQEFYEAFYISPTSDFLAQGRGTHFLLLVTR